MDKRDIQQRITDLAGQIHRTAMGNIGEDGVQGSLAAIEELLEIVAAQQAQIDKLQKQVEGIDKVN